jgi:hypothetical protein
MVYHFMLVGIATRNIENDFRRTGSARYIIGANFSIHVGILMVCLVLT